MHEDTKIPRDALCALLAAVSMHGLMTGLGSEFIAEHEERIADVSIRLAKHMAGRLRIEFPSIFE